MCLCVGPSLGTHSLWCQVPERALRWFTFREMEVLVCGDPLVDVDLLESKATYQGWDAGAPGVSACLVECLGGWALRVVPKAVGTLVWRTVSCVCPEARRCHLSPSPCTRAPPPPLAARLSHATAPTYAQSLPPTPPPARTLSPPPPCFHPGHPPPSFFTLCTPPAAQLSNAMTPPPLPFSDRCGGSGARFVPCPTVTGRCSSGLRGAGRGCPAPSTGPRRSRSRARAAATTSCPSRTRAFSRWEAPCGVAGVRRCHGWVCVSAFCV
jgi:hypothetical protein